MPEQIEEEVKELRAEILMEQQQCITEKYNETLLDKEIDVLVEGFDRYAECFFGRSKADSPDVDGKVFFTCSERKPYEGEIVKVRVDDFLNCDPIGEMIN